MAGFKQAKNLTGLVVCENPKVALTKLYRRILLVLAKAPEHSVYRKNTENIVKKRSYIVNSNDDVKTIEEKIGCGEIEELIIQARNELELAEKLLLCRPWESLISPIPKNQWKWPPK